MRSHRPRKRFGQHFLSQAWASKVVAAINPAPGDVFLEIGPGKGALTMPLAAFGAPIVAIEIDRDLASDLAGRVPRNVSVVTGDVLKSDVIPYLSGLEPQRPPELSGYKPAARRIRIVGNLPYNLTSPILFRLAELQSQHQMFYDATLMLQKEVAARQAARSGTRDYGVLTVTMQVHGTLKRGLDLPPGAFKPAPKVQSSVVQLIFGPPPVKIGDPRQFLRVTKAVFSQRRKVLSNALKSVTPRPAEALKEAGIDPRRRPETLTLEELARLAQLCGQSPIQRPEGD